MTVHSLLFVDHATGLGGAERSLLLLVEHLDRERWRAHVAGAEGPLLADVRRLGVATHATPLPRLRRSGRFAADLLRGAGNLLQVIRQSRADLVIANTVRAAIYSSVAARLARKPFVWYMRDFWLGENRPAHVILDAAGKWLLAAASSAVIANSRAVAGQLPQTEKVSVVHNGIKIAAFGGPIHENFRLSHGIAAGAPLVGMIGRMRPWKGQLQFLDMARRVHDAVPQARFAIVGGDPFAISDGYEVRVRERALLLGLEDIVSFSGHLSDVRPALAAFDLFVHPGDPEPFGLVNVEAMAMGVPLIAFAHGALPEIVVDGHTGLLAPAGDGEAMAQAIMRLLGDGEQRRAMGQAARERAARHFSIERTVHEVETVLWRLVGNGA